MGQPVVHFEVTGKDPAKLRSYYGALFGWEFDTSAPVAAAISEPGNYGFVERNTTSDGTGIPGGVGGGTDHDGHAIFYVGVPDVLRLVVSTLLGTMLFAGITALRCASLR